MRSQDESVGSVSAAVIATLAVVAATALSPCFPEHRIGAGEAPLLAVVGGLITLCGLAGSC